MNKKIIIILVTTLLIASGIVNANIIKKDGVSEKIKETNGLELFTTNDPVFSIAGHVYIKYIGGGRNVAANVYVRCYCPLSGDDQYKYTDSNGYFSFFVPKRNFNWAYYLTVDTNLKGYEDTFRRAIFDSNTNNLYIYPKRTGIFQAEIGLTDNDEPITFLDGNFITFLVSQSLKGNATVYGDRQDTFQGFLLGKYLYLVVPIHGIISGRIIYIHSWISIEINENKMGFTGTWKNGGLPPMTGWINGTFIY